MRHSCWKTYINYQNDKLPSAIKKRYFWWKDITKLLDKFKGIATVNLADGRTCLLWWDIWEGQVCAQAYPKLLSFNKLENLSVQKAWSSTSIEQLFHLPLSSEAYSQLLVLCDKLDGLNLISNHDPWSYIWGSPFFSSSKTYKQLTGHAFVPPPFRWLWKNCRQHNKVFFWLLLKDGLSTRDLLRRKGMFLQSHDCVLYDRNTMETLHHLFLLCPLAIQFWASIGLTIPASDNYIDVIISFRRFPFCNLSYLFCILFCFLRLFVITLLIYLIYNQ